MADDIVIGNVKYRRIQGDWTMTPRGTRGMFHIDPRRRELLDEIERLRAERDDLQVLLRGRTAEFQAEIERLRKHVNLRTDATTPVCSGERDKEARRG